GLGRSPLRRGWERHLVFRSGVVAPAQPLTPHGGRPFDAPPPSTYTGTTGRSAGPGARGAHLPHPRAAYGRPHNRKHKRPSTRGATTPQYGIPFNVVHGNSQTKVHVVIDAYSSESDLQNAPVPANAVIEGDYQGGPRAGVNNRGDSHLIVWDEDSNVAYEFYRA